MFYETLIEQLPNSEMAQEWCLAYGILDQNRAFKLNAIVCKRKGKSVPSTQQNGKILSSQTGKSVIASKTTNSKRKKTTVDDDVIGDTGLICYIFLRMTLNNHISLGLDSSSAWEGIGTTGI